VRFVVVLCSTVLSAQTAAHKSSPSSTAAHKAATTSAKAATTAAPALTTDDQKILYALGLNISRSIGQFDLSPAELAIVERGMQDQAAGKPAEDLETWGPKIQELARTRVAGLTAKQKAAGSAYAAKAAAEPGAVKTDSGLVYRELQAGTGPMPKATDTVKVNYRGTLINGTEFDSSYKRNQPAQFALNGVIPCWTEGLQHMKAGGKGQLVCPSSIAYGDRGTQGIPPGATLVFEVELLDVGGSGPSAGK
jgi:FKBP-type peptidyl-prolyl cis-trans isomerase FkpA